MFYKLINNTPVPFGGRYLKMNNRIYANPTEPQLRECGYKPLVTADEPLPRDGYYCTPVYAENETEIVQSWAEHIMEDAEPEESTEGENGTNI